MNILRKQFLAHVGQTSPSPMLVEVERAEGVYFYTPEGKRYYDLIAGVSVSNVGHCNPQVVKAVQEQAAKYMHVMVYGELVETPQVRYAKLLADHLPAAIDAVYFLNSGAEAVEGALKLAKRYTGRTEMISMRRAYHGSTHGAMSMMGQPEGEEWKQAFRPLLPDTKAIEFNDFEQLEQITERTACVLVEPVQGEAGVRPPKCGYLEALRRRCDEVGALLIFDEIQVGMGRTGKMFASERYGVTPDIICLAKALGGGMPLGAFAARHEVMDTLQTNPVLGHITTFGGHPVCCAAGLAAMEYILENKLLESVEAKGALYESLLKDHPAVKEVRRAGLLLAVELGESEKLYRMMELFKELGILSDWFLYCDTAFRISPPLTITEAEILESTLLIREALDRLEQ
ncbi:MAG: aspartate aminotransferase family protein [Rikenellaceae bacterium]|nr:aspartate aminotransferase family protein [Rikenellaceae bacterium]